jgi:polysaccharide pyruvyl transferase WcaK-like protein
MSDALVVVCSAATLTPDGFVSNVGDEAVTACLMQAVERSNGFRVLGTLNTTGYPGAQLPDGRFPIRPLRSLADAIRAADVVIAGGGTLLQEDVRPRGLQPTAGLLRYLVVVAVLARLWRKPLVLYGVGAENLNGTRARFATRLICRAARDVVLRDDDSARLLEEITGRRFRVGADAAFLMDPPAAAGTGDPTICVNIRKDLTGPMLDALRTLLERLLEEGWRVLLVPMDRRSGEDTDALARLVAGLPGRDAIELASPQATWSEIVALLAGADVCIGMRLHFLIFSALAARPTVALTTSPKTTSFASLLGLDQLEAGSSGADLEGVVASAKAPSAGELERLRSVAWDELARTTRRLA